MSRRVAITGAPGAGKTHRAALVAAKLKVTPTATDEFGDLPWSEQSERTAGLLGGGGPWVIEGTTVARGLRKWLRANPEGKPCDVVVYMPRAREPQQGGRASMSKAVDTVMQEILHELRERGVEIKESD